MKLLSFTRIYNLPWGIDLRYLTIGVVEFEYDIHAMGRINLDESEVWDYLLIIGR